jgi:hypothetical protein
MSIDALTLELNQALADFVSAAEQSNPVEHLKAIEQTLVDLVCAVEKFTQADMGGVADAIKNMKLSVTVTAGPVHVSVQPTPIEITVPEPSGSPFRPLTLRINRQVQTGLIDTVDIFEKA